MTAHSTSLRGLAQGLLAPQPRRERLDLLVEHCAIRVETNSPELHASLSRYFRQYLGRREPFDVRVIVMDADPPDLPFAFQVAPPAPGKARIKDEYVDFVDGRILRKRLTGMVFLFGQPANIAIGPCRENQNQVVNFINNRFVQWHVDRGYSLCHAAGVARGGRGVLIAGVAGRGKSTLALNLLSRGLDFVSNDRLLIRRGADGPQMLGLPKAPRINPGTILNNPHLVDLLTDSERARFAQLTAAELWELEHKYDVDILDFFGRRGAQLRAALCGALLLDWRRGAGGTQMTRVELDAHRDLLRAVIKPLGVHYHACVAAHPPDCSEAAYLAKLAGCPAVHVTGGIDFDAAAHACLELIAGGGTQV